MALSNPSILELRGVFRSFESGVGKLCGVDLGLAPGTWTWLAGAAEGGKNAAFRVLGLAVAPEAGELILGGETLSIMTTEARAEVRARKLGFVAAAPFLLPAFNAIENLAVPLLKVSRVTLEDAQEKITALLHFADLLARKDCPVAELTAAEQLRLTLARALANDPLAILVEELDPEQMHALGERLHAACESFGVAIVALGQPPDSLRSGERVVEFSEGRIVRDSARVAAVPGTT